MQLALVASTNPVKVNAAQAALNRCLSKAGNAAPTGPAWRVQGVSSQSGVKDQPIGDDETLQGALNRASGLAAGTQSPDALLLVAVEGGVLWRGADLFCFAWAVVRSRQGAVSKARSAEFMLPPAIAQLVAQGAELGAADDKVFGRTSSGQGSGTVGRLTDNLITRQLYYQHTMELALIPFMNPQLYLL